MVVSERARNQKPALLTTMDLTNLNKERKAKRKPSLDLSTMVYGKVPPQAKELEEAVLGAVMLEKSAFDTVS